MAWLNHSELTYAMNHSYVQSYRLAESETICPIDFELWKIDH